MQPLQMWAGLECTLNRVGDCYIDQSEKNGHTSRISDLKLFAQLNLKKIRYPCLWERVAPDDLDHCDWSYLDGRLNEIRKLGISPIAGFLHHGSGPIYTNLLDPEFPVKLALYARKFAIRFPWVEDYTPVNEILTTARFSCLYGHWYPHKKEHASFIKAIFNQVKGTILAMRAIREIIPKARLIQTDDLGRAQSTEELKYQADFENERRWLGWDLLCGKISGDHPIAWYLKAGMSDEDFTWLINNSGPPDIIGINHYHLSNRFLDHRMELYPEWSHGGNEIDKYADVGAVDTGQSELPDPASILIEAWERYHIPIAVTEVHTIGHREAQMRWLYQMWNAAKLARTYGAEIRAITPWSLLGTYDWHKLCTVCEMFYEPGVYDMRSTDKIPRSTGLSYLVKELSTNGDADHPILQLPGWWKTKRRILWGARHGEFSTLSTSNHRPIVITGATGTLGQAFARICGERNIPYRILKRSDLDIGIIDDVRTKLNEFNPWVVINAAGYVNVDLAEDDKERCFRENVFGPLNLATACAEKNIPIITFSSDLVFDGKSIVPYIESDKANPLNIYGESKAESERLVMRMNDKALIIRTSSFFGPWDEHNFVTNVLKILVNKNEVTAANDTYITPTYIPDLVNATLDLILDSEKGIVHLTNKDTVSWEGFAQIAASTARNNFELNPALIIGKSSLEMNFKAKRPRNSALKSERYEILPSLEDALNRYFNHLDKKL